MNFVIIGKITGAFGRKGYIKVIPMADEKVFKDIKRIYLKRRGGDYVPFDVECIRKHGGFFIVKIKGCDSIEEAEKFSNAHVFLPEDDLPPLGKDEFYYYQLIGLDVYDSTGNKLGKVKSLQDIGPYYLIELDNGKTYIPFVSEIVKEVDIEKKRIVVDETKIVISS